MTDKLNQALINLSCNCLINQYSDMLPQAKMLVSRLKSTIADVDNKWKLVNFFIGGNDLCDACKDVNEFFFFINLSNFNQLEFIFRH